VLTGVIEMFDDRRGDGLFRGDDGRAYYFHCVAIADGTRTITPGVRAQGRRSVGRLGHDEVVDVARITP
jgi:cold shock CspA family protein